MHSVRRSASIVLAANSIYAGHSQGHIHHGYTQASLVDHVSGSVHTGLSLNELAARGGIAPHIHSFEESFYILEGQAVVTGNDEAYLLGPGDFGVFKVGTPHSWRNAGTGPVRWVQMAAPQPKPAGKERDTFFIKDGLISLKDGSAKFSIDGPVPSAQALDLNDLRGNLFGHFDVGQIPPPAQRGAAIVGSPGVFLKWMIDENLGARHQRMLFIEYQPGADIPLHDHTFEEAYFILSGEIAAVLDGERYTARAGDVIWTGVGCVHTFTNVSSEAVRWIETFSPQPPAENVFRFSAEWEKKAKEIEG